MFTKKKIRSCVWIIFLVTKTKNKSRQRTFALCVVLHLDCLLVKLNSNNLNNGCPEKKGNGNGAC